MTTAFIYCPQCGSASICDSDYDDCDDIGNPVSDFEIVCENCGWEGRTDELVCKDGE